MKQVFLKLKLIKLFFSMDFSKLKSRKLWVAVIGGTILALADQLGIDHETANQIVVIISSFLVGQGIADGFGKNK